MLERMRLRAATITLVTALAGCAGDGVTGNRLVDGGLGPLVIDGSVGKSVLERGDTTMVSFRLRNVSKSAVTLQFSSGCQLLWFIAAWPGEPIIYPPGGVWACTLALTELNLAPGEEHSIGMLIRAYPPPMPAIYSGVPLGPGEYVIFARLQHTDFPLQSEVLHLTVR